MTLLDSGTAGPVPAPRTANDRRRHGRVGRLPVVLAAGWLVFLVAHRLLSGRWWLWLAPELLPPLLFVAVPVLLAVLGGPSRRHRRPVLLLALAALLLGAGLSGLNPGVLGTPAPAPSDALRIVSWNTGVWNLDDDPDRFYALLTAARADVYLLQEYTPDADPARRDADLARLRREFPGYQMAAKGELVTLSRYPIEAVRPLPVAPPPAADWRTEYWEVKTLRTDLRVGGRTLSVYNAHILIPLDLVSPTRSVFWEHRRDWYGRREAQYRGLVADLAGNPLPTVLAGDFNTSAASADIAPVADRLRDAARSTRTPYPVSWSILGLPLWRVDWAFTSDGVTAHDYRLRDPRGMSDHRMQDLRISLDGTR